MSAVSMSFGHSHGLAFPRGSIWFGNMAAALINGIRRLDAWQVQRRAMKSDDVEDVLAWAQRIENTDPGFAADLRGAAMRAASRKDL